MEGNGNVLVVPIVLRAEDEMGISMMILPTTTDVTGKGRKP